MDSLLLIPIQRAVYKWIPILVLILGNHLINHYLLLYFVKFFIYIYLFRHIEVHLVCRKQSVEPRVFQLFFECWFVGKIQCFQLQKRIYICILTSILIIFCITCGKSPTRSTNSLIFNGTGSSTFSPINWFRQILNIESLLDNAPN